MVDSTWTLQAEARFRTDPIPVPTNEQVIEIVLSDDGDVKAKNEKAMTQSEVAVVRSRQPLPTQLCIQGWSDPQAG